jgi:hypothetical protein
MAEMLERVERVEMLEILLWSMEATFGELFSDSNSCSDCVFGSVRVLAPVDRRPGREGRCWWWNIGRGFKTSS